MTQKGILRELIELLTNKLKEFDFEPSFKVQGFIRKTSNAIFIYQFFIYNRTLLGSGKKGFLLEPSVWVHVNKMEEYYKKITLNKGIKADIDFRTIGNSIAGILSNPEGVYKNRNKSLNLHIFEEGHVEIVAMRLFKLFKEVTLPYCLNNSTIASVDKLINTKPDEYKVHMGNDNHRIIKGLIAAKLNNNRNLNELIRIYDKQLIERDMLDDTKEEMRRLKEILPEMK
jgi:hypothetical protein